MSDTLTPEQRSWNMSKIKGKDTSIEIKVRHFLFKKGFRYRKNVSKLLGKPDIVFAKYHTVVFIHGCFWHRHEGCKDATIPKTRTEFWIEKLSKNVANDRKHIVELQSAGWKVIVLWECEITRNFETTMEKTIKELLADSSCL